MPELTISGTLTESPQTSGDSPFPSATTTIPFVQNPATSPKTPAVSTGRKLINASSPAAFVTADGVGADQTVTQATTLYARTTAAGFKLRLTFADPQGGADIVSVVPLSGVFLLEPDPAGYCKKIEYQGAGQLELYASGPS